MVQYGMVEHTHTQTPARAASCSTAALWHERFQMAKSARKSQAPAPVAAVEATAPAPTSFAVVVVEPTAPAVEATAPVVEPTAPVAKPAKTRLLR